MFNVTSAAFTDLTTLTSTAGIENSTDAVNSAAEADNSGSIVYYSTPMLYSVIIMKAIIKFI